MSTTTITIPVELVSLVRDGAYFDLHGQLDETGALVEPRSRRDIRVEVDGGLARANGARALLDVVGWIEPVYEPFAVEVDLHEHREALLRALGTRIESERNAEDDKLAGLKERAEAKVRAGQLANLIARVKDGGIGTVTVPARFVDLLREALLVRLATAAGEIENAGRTPSNGIDPTDLEPFDAYRATLEAIGLVRTVPAVAVEVNVDAHRWALETALSARLDLERDFMDVPATPEGARQHERARRRTSAIEAFMADAGLQGGEDADER